MDKVSKEKRSEIMRAVKNCDSKIEIEFRRALWRLGFRYRKNASNYFGKPDIVLKKHKAVIFVDSCFWHGCKQHCRMPSDQKDYWMRKIERNRIRDMKVNQYYHEGDWLVLRIWEHDLKYGFEDAIQETTAMLDRRNSSR